MEVHSRAQAQSKQQTANMLQNYKIVKDDFGEGSCSSVMLAQDVDSNRWVVIKKIRKLKIKSERIRNEVAAGRRLQHANIVKFIEHFEDEKCEYLVFDYISGSDLLTYMMGRSAKPLSERSARYIFQCVLAAVKCAHKQGVAHLDIKMENIMVSNSGRIVLIDFGFCSVSPKDDIEENNNKLCNNWVGTMEYVAPEVLLHKPYLSFQADIWSLGVLLFAMVFLRFPFITKQRTEALINGYEHPQVTFPSPSSKTFPYEISQNLKDLIVQLLNPNADERPSLEEIEKHPWLQTTR